MKFADLHVHTLFSDGTSTAEEVVVEAQRQDLAAIAIVDHDTIEGIAATVEIGQGKGLEVLPGIELSAEYDGLEIHILGYLIDYQNKKLKEKLDFLKQSRIQRIYDMLDKLKDMGIILEAGKVFDIAKEGTVGRLHIARAMLKEKCVGSIADVFQKYIGDKSPAYVCGFKFSPREAIELIRDMGGIAVLAHPYILHRDELIPEFVGYGLQGLEVYYPEHSQSMINFYLGLAQKFGLLATGGSDFHGSAKPDVKMGLVRVPYDLVEALKKAKAAK